MMKRSATLLAALLATSTLAEQSKFNLHLEPAVGTGINKPAFISGGWLKVDTTVFHLGPVAPQIEIFGIGSQSRSVLAEGAAFGAGIGLRLRLLNDEKGFFFNPGTTNTGNLWGNLWLDADLTFAHAGLGLGFDAGLGYEFSLIDGLQIGPFARFAWTGPSQLLLFGLSFSVGFPSEIPPDADPDGDGIKGTTDKCPNEAEDFDKFQDEDGCPEADNDLDGFEDKKDQCPDQAEDKNGFQDTDGCPDATLDTDGDGILDLKDKCIKEPEDKNGFEDDDGCPDGARDTDGDTIPDAVDKCPKEPEDKDGFQDDDGCPDKDNDGDGIEDEKDKCRDEAETLNGIDDDDGCPEKETKVFITTEKVVITEKILFAFNKANILAKSDGLLDNVATVLNKFPQIRKVRIEGHTDDVGDDKVNQVLSEARCKSVLDALVKRKVDTTRLEIKGYGKSAPLVKERTDAAREQNRRVEFVILDMVPIVEEVK